MNEREQHRAMVLNRVERRGLTGVEATARQAVDMDYQVIVLGDGCADRDAQANKVAVVVLLPRIATVASAEDFAAGQEG